MIGEADDGTRTRGRSAGCRPGRSGSSQWRGALEVQWGGVEDVEDRRVRPDLITEHSDDLGFSGPRRTPATRAREDCEDCGYLRVETLKTVENSATKGARFPTPLAQPLSKAFT